MREPARAEGHFQTSDRPPPDTAKLAREAWQHGEAAASQGDLDRALRWMDRAHRLAPADRNLAFFFGLLHLRAGDPAAAMALFAPIADRHGGREALAAVAHCALRLNDLPRAEAALGRLLRGYAADHGAETLANRLASLGAVAHWIALREDLSLAGSHAWHESANPSLRLRLDGKLLRGGRLPPNWQTARTLSARHNGKDILGSPIDLAAILHTEGIVQARRGRLEGWAWHPGAPDTDPVLSVRTQSGKAIATIVAADLSASIDGMSPLARPRGFSMTGLPDGPLHIIGRDGRPLLGSPLSLRLTRSPAPKRAGRQAKRPGPVCIVIPVYRGLDTTMACLDRVLATKRAADQVIVVNDASPEPGLVTALRRRRGLTLIAASPRTPARNLGFPGAANAGLRAAGGRDVVLLNSDTLVFPGWLEALQQAAHGASDIGTATPLSNDASIFSYPTPAGPNPVPSAAEASELSALAARANPGLAVTVPTANGFCMLIRADCLAATGLFRQDAFAQGYGEENDFSERARHAGFRHVAVPGVYVAHIGGVSFGGAGWHLLRRNQDVLARLHPGYPARVARFMAKDSLRPARARLDAARLTARSVTAAQSGSVLLVTHGFGGGTARVVADRAAELRAQGLRPILLIGKAGRTEIEADGETYPNLSFTLPADRQALAELLAPTRPVAMEVHHPLGQDHSITALAADFAIPIDIFLHDYAWLCLRVTFVTGEGRFCGEADPATCVLCEQRFGRLIDDPIAPAALRQRSAALFQSARRVIVPHAESASRLRRHMPRVSPIIRALEDDSRFPQIHRKPRGDTLTIAIIGALGAEKGYDVLLACARDAASRALPLQFVVVGYTIDDPTLLDTGRIFITGQFRPEEAAELIRRQGADLAFLPSIWPETWCFALGDAWDAGLAAAVFDIGAPAARVRETGRGWVLPLGLPAARVNEALLNLQPLVDRQVAQGLVHAHVTPAGEKTVLQDMS